MWAGLYNPSFAKQQKTKTLIRRLGQITKQQKQNIKQKSNNSHQVAGLTNPGLANGFQLGKEPQIGLLVKILPVPTTTLSNFLFLKRTFKNQLVKILLAVETICI